MNKYGKTSIVLASLMLPVTLLASGIVAWHLKESNPNGVDITSNMAYLKQILGTSLVVGTILWLGSLVTALLGLKKDTTAELSKFALLLLAVVTVFCVASSIVTKNAGDVVEAARDKQTTAALKNYV